MAQPDNANGVPHSSGSNRFATKKTLAITLVVIAFALVAIWVPW